MQNQTDAIAKTNTWLPRRAGPYVFDVLFDDGPHDVVSFFLNPIYRIKISTGSTSSALLTVVSSLYTGAGTKSINDYFLQKAWKSP